MVDTEEGSSGNRLTSLLTGLPVLLTTSAALVTATIALIGFLNRGDGGTGTTSPTTDPDVKILSPRPGRVPWRNPIVIRYSNVGQDSDLWLVERSDTYYPHPDCPGEKPTVMRAPGQQSGTWDSTIEIGTKDTPAGERFELYVLLASEQASELLRTQVKGWCDPTMPWPGISALPEKADVAASVAVRR
jgi:hypothetical protein